MSIRSRLAWLERLLPPPPLPTPEDRQQEQRLKKLPRR